MLKTTFETRVALGSHITLLVVHEEPLDAANLLRELWIRIYTFEKRFSRFLHGSELTRFNVAAGQRQTVSPEFHDLLVAARRMAVASDGLYNPFVLPALQRTGYLQSLVAAHAADEQVDFSDRAVVDAAALRIGQDWAEIPYNTALDMGGCGKGYLGDELAAYMRSCQVAGYWFSLGGDIVCCGTDVDGEPWIVHIADSADDVNACRYHFVAPPSGVLAVATSGITARTGVAHGKPWHHILDPATGHSAVTDVVRASVDAPTLLEADVLASCAIIAGSQKAPAYLEKHAVNGYLLVTAGERQPPLIGGTAVRHSQAD